MKKLSALVVLLACALDASALNFFVHKLGRPVTNTVPVVQYVPFYVTNTVTTTNIVPAGVDATGAPVAPHIELLTQNQVIRRLAPVTNEVQLVTYEMTDAARAGSQLANGAAASSGSPVAVAIIGGFTTLLGGLFSIYNARQRQKAEGRANTAELVNVALTQSAEAAKGVAITLAGTKGGAYATQVNSYINGLMLATQQAAGVESAVRDLVNQHTGYTHLEQNLTLPVPAPATA